MKLPIVATLTLAALSSVAGADEADDIREASKAEAETFNARMYAGAPGNKAYACFVRRYDTEHLARHPKQKVVAMKLLISAEIEEDQELHNSFRLGFRYRHRPGDFDSSGSCRHAVFTKSGNEVRLGCGEQVGNRAARTGAGLAEQQAGPRGRTIAGGQRGR